VDDGESSSRERLKYDDSIDDNAAPISEDGLRLVAEQVRGAFPRPFTLPELVLIDVDPRHLHAFWNLPLDRLEAARRALPAGGDANAPMVLRSSHGDGSEPFDVEVQGLQGQVYVDIWDAARSYRGSLGLRLADGSLAVLIEGGVATLPALGPVQAPSAMLDVAPPAYGRTFKRGAAKAVAGGPAALANRPAGAIATGAPGLQPAAGEPLAEPFASPPTEAGAFDPAMLAGAQPGAADEATQAEAGIPPWPDASRADGAPVPLELENALTLSSFVLGRETVQLEVNAELHVFGRARPGSELKLFGRRVAVRPDGSFSITRPLPNGALVLTALLTGGDGE